MICCRAVEECACYILSRDLGKGGNMSEPAVTQDADLEEMVRRLVAEFRPTHIYLFGSAARGEMHRDSDLDLLVVVGSSAEAPYRRAQNAHRALWGVPRAADVFVVTEEEFERQREWITSVPAAALAEGKELYVAA